VLREEGASVPHKSFGLSVGCESERLAGMVVTKTWCSFGNGL
jgi:hypothetical protein